MAKTLREYMDWLDGRNLVWPRPARVVPVKASPSVKPLRGIKAVTWSVYGTLLRISDGRLLLDHPQELRMQVAMEKTLREFNMWQSMTRKPGEPWKQIFQQYASLLSQARLSAAPSLGDVAEIDTRKIWRLIVGRLQKKEYTYDRGLYGNEDELAEKIAYFFHASLQGVEAAANAAAVVTAVSCSGLTQTLLADGQAFTLAQMLRALGEQATLPPPGKLFAFDAMTLSFQERIRKPTPVLYRICLQRLEASGISADETLHVSSRLRDDLAVAKRFGMRTALYAGDQNGFEVKKEDVQDPELRPDRLLTDLQQLATILEIERFRTE